MAKMTPLLRVYDIATGRLTAVLDARYPQPVANN